MSVPILLVLFALAPLVQQRTFVCGACLVEGWTPATPSPYASGSVAA